MGKFGRLLFGLAAAAGIYAGTSHLIKKYYDYLSEEGGEFKDEEELNDISFEVEDPLKSHAGAGEEFPGLVKNKNPLFDKTEDLQGDEVNCASVSEDPTACETGLGKEVSQDKTMSQGHANDRDLGNTYNHSQDPAIVTAGRKGLVDGTISNVANPGEIKK